jgi:hypothetical protein
MKCFRSSSSAVYKQQLIRKQQEEIIAALDAADTGLSDAKDLKERLLELRQTVTNSILI